MNPLSIKGTEDMPEVIMDKENGIFKVSGNSFSDDPISTFKPIFDWVDEYIKAPNSETDLEIKMNYMNTASSKQITELLMRFKKAEAASNVLVKWHYDKMDDDMKFDGETLKAVVQMNFDLLEY